MAFSYPDLKPVPSPTTLLILIKGNELKHHVLESQFMWSWFKLH